MLVIGLGIRFLLQRFLPAVLLIGFREAITPMGGKQKLTGRNLVLTERSMQEKKRLAGEVDIFSTEVVEDMFADEPVAAPAAAGHNAPKRGLLDNYDDSEGYYNFQVPRLSN